MYLPLLSISWGASLILGQIISESGINSSAPCIAGNRGHFSSDGIPNISYVKLSNQDDVNAIDMCNTFNGSILIEPSFQGEVVLPNLVYIAGLLGWYNNSAHLTHGNLTGLILPNLTSVDPDPSYPSADIGSISLVNISSLKTIWLPSLRNVTGAVVLSDLPALVNLSGFHTLTGTGANYGSGLLIRSTNLTSISVQVEQMNDMAFVENPSLVNFTLESSQVVKLTVSAATIELCPRVSCEMIIERDLDVSGCQTYGSNVVVIGGSFSFHDTTVLSISVIMPVFGDLLITRNSALQAMKFSQSRAVHGSENTSPTRIDGNFNVSTCPDLANLTLAQAELRGITGSLNITENQSLTFVNFPDLTSIDSSVLISGCTSLTNISMPNLQSIEGNFIISNNTMLETITGFPNLQTIYGTLSMEGNFSSVELPKLTEVFNDFIINSTNPTLNCSDFYQLKAQKFVRGSFSCSTPDHTLTIAAHNSLSEGAKGGIGAGVGVVAIGIITAFVYLAKKRGYLTRNGKPVPDKGSDPISELPKGGHHEKVEVPAISKSGELPGVPVVPGPISDLSVTQASVGKVEESEQEQETHELQ